MQILYSIAAELPKTLLQRRGPVKFQRPGPFRLTLSIEDIVLHSLELPFPINVDAGRARIACKSLWIEYTAPVSSPDALQSHPSAVFPMPANASSQPFLEHLHYVVPEMLPKLQVAELNALWLTAHASIMGTTSGVELLQYENLGANEATLTMTGRLGVKESLHSIYMHVFGHMGASEMRNFRLGNGASDMGWVHVDAIRMDVSNQTVFLDAAFIPLCAGSGLGSVQAVLRTCQEDVMMIQMQDEEQRFWKHLLPTYAERRRSWEHQVSFFRHDIEVEENHALTLS